MNEREKEIQAIVGRCKHFNGIQHDICLAGVNYDAVKDHSQDGPILLPCWARDPFSGRNRTCRTTCDKREFPNRIEAEIEADETEAAIAMFIADLRAGLCPTHRIPITKRQVGRCVYAAECGCRLYQGRL